jgi:N-methylhydantoinase B/oxoprolinase/acetone carboxylase alpha subunit
VSHAVGSPHRQIANENRLRAGERLIVHTAGAGGWGNVQDRAISTASTADNAPVIRASGSIAAYAQAQAEF